MTEDYQPPGKLPPPTPPSRNPDDPPTIEIPPPGIVEFNELVKRRFENSKIKITPYAFDKANYICKKTFELNAGIQVGFYLISDKDNQSEKIINDVFIAYDQTNDPTHCDISPIGKIKSFKAIRNIGKRIVGWGHSHGDITNFYSKMDEKTLEGLVNQWGMENSNIENVRYFYGMVFNARNDEPFCVVGYKIDGKSPKVLHNIGYKITEGSKLDKEIIDEEISERIKILKKCENQVKEDFKSEEVFEIKIRKFILGNISNGYNHENREIDKINLEEKKRGGLGFQKIEKDTYLITVDIPAYIIEKEGKFYAFDKIKIGTELRFREDKVMIKYSPHVLKEGYNHPQVFDDGTISYGSLMWGQQRNVKFNYWYNISDSKTARRIAIALKEGKLILEKGCVGKKYIPVHSLEECNCLVAENRYNAEKYALKKGIKLERIINND